MKLHCDNKSKIEIINKVAIEDEEGLNLAYTPGGDRVKREIFLT